MGGDQTLLLGDETNFARTCSSTQLAKRANVLITLRVMVVAEGVFAESTGVHQPSQPFSFDQCRKLPESRCALIGLALENRVSPYRVGLWAVAITRA
jgi:hypothetical protein